MQISGLQKITLVDFPGVVAATVFTRGCSFRCPFCHNPELVLPEKFLPVMSEAKIVEFLESRRGKLQGVCITGGEPLLQKDIHSFIYKLKDLGFKIKLDTNGSFPDKLKELIDGGNLDYIAMDIKSSLPKYEETIQVKSQKPALPAGRSKVKNTELLNNVKESIDLIMKSGIDYEFRTTICHPLHEVDDFNGIGQLISGAKRFFIQNFVESKHVDSLAKFKPFSEKELEKSLSIIKRYVNEAGIR